MESYRWQRSQRKGTKKDTRQGRTEEKKARKIREKGERGKRDARSNWRIQEKVFRKAPLQENREKARGARADKYDWVGETQEAPIVSEGSVCASKSWGGIGA